MKNLIDKIIEKVLLLLLFLTTIHIICYFCINVYSHLLILLSVCCVGMGWFGIVFSSTAIFRPMHLKKTKWNHTSLVIWKALRENIGKRGRVWAKQRNRAAIHSQALCFRKAKNRSQQCTCTPRTSHPSSAETPSPPGPPPCLSLRQRANMCTVFTSATSDKCSPNRLLSKCSVWSLRQLSYLSTFHLYCA